MIVGRFETFSRRPVVDCFINIPALRVSGAVSFLIDTGADTTLLMPADARRLGVKYSDLIYTRVSTGVGGECEEYIVPAQLLVSDEKAAFGYRLVLGIARPFEYLEECPSIIGTDILKNWKVVLDYPNCLEIYVKICDEEREL